MKDVKSFNEELEKAKKELEFLASNREAQEAYIERENELRDYIFDVEYSREKGRKEGEEIGEKHGKEIGRKEERIEMVKEMKKLNIDIDTIVKVSKLSREEIDEIV